MIKQIKNELRKHVNPEKRAFYPKFFKTGKGEYGEGDQFLGLTVPQVRQVVKLFKAIDLDIVELLINDPYHEVRLLGLLILVGQYERGDEQKKKQIYHFYIEHRLQVNNWDLVDLTAYKIVGHYLLNRERKRLYTLAKSSVLWDRRIAMVSCFAFIRQNDFTDALAIAGILVGDDHDLMHKAVGWMLREIGKRDQSIEERFLKKHYQAMPRTMLRYAIEKFEEPKRQFYLKG